MKIEYLNFDSYNATKTNNEAFNASFTILCKYRNVKKIYLKNLELPIGFPNIRSSNNSNVLSFLLDSSLFITNIPQGYYNSISSVITALNSAIASVISASYTFILSVNSTNNIVVNITNVSSPSTPVIYTISPTTLATILGISTLVNVNSLTTTTTNTIYNLSYDNYISMVFTNIPSLMTGANANYASSIKVPLNAIPYSVYYYITDRNTYDQSLTIIDSNFILDTFQIQIYDRFGYQLSNGNLDYSFTLAIEYDE
jgi:hypothetical protein